MSNAVLHGLTNTRVLRKELLNAQAVNDDDTQHVHIEKSRIKHPESGLYGNNFIKD
ncbi:hypothetical protein [Bartonella koehlerae]|uniref:hypothetical protein n=1 Tax=Bartonella koehlerae TaxID=92181 RepID=UPI000A49969D|nr:hypothetical protein [Bartonella koehlerae]